MSMATKQWGFESKQRATFADIARGLAVIYFLWCHTVDIHMAWVDTWAMPVFFVVMGMFFKPTATWREMILKKINTILVPFFLLSIPSYILSAVTMPVKDFLLKLVNPYECVYGVGWFLICIFWCYLIYYGIRRITNNSDWKTAVVCITVSVLNYYASTQRVMGYRILLPMFLSTSLTVLPFICIGDTLRGFIKKERSVATECLSALVLVSCTCTGIYLLQFRGGEYIVHQFYGQSWLTIFLLSVMGTASILVISKLLPRTMRFAGEHSLLFLMVHPYIIRILQLFELPPVAVFSATLVATLILIGVLSHYFPVLEGKKRLFK